MLKYLKKAISLGVVILMLTLLPAALIAQEAFGDFGFGDSDSFGFSGSSGPSINIGGEVSAELKGFFDEMGSTKKFGNIRPGDVFSGSLKFDAAGSSAQAFVGLNLTPVFDGSSPWI